MLTQIPFHLVPAHIVTQIGHVFIEDSEHIESIALSSYYNYRDSVHRSPSERVWSFPCTYVFVYYLLTRDISASVLPHRQNTLDSSARQEEQQDERPSTSGECDDKPPPVW